MHGIEEAGEEQGQAEAAWMCPYGSARPGLADHLRQGSLAAERVLESIARVESLGKRADLLARSTLSAGRDMAGPNAALLRVAAEIGHEPSAVRWIEALRLVAERSERGNAALAREIALSLAAVEAVHRRLAFLQRRSVLVSRYGRFLGEAMLRQALVIPVLDREECVEARHDFEIEAANIRYLAQRVCELCEAIEAIEAKASRVMCILARRIERMLAAQARR